MITKQTGSLNDNYKKAESKASVATSPEKSKKSKGAFRTISEVADELGVQQHVLRFWETKFSHIRPLKRGGGRRYYRPEDVAVLKRIYELLYTEGYTIKGVQKLFRANGKSSVMEGEVGGAAHTDISIEVESAEPNKPVNEPDHLASDTAENSAVQAEAKEITISGFNDSQRQMLKSTLADLKELRALVTPD